MAVMVKAAHLLRTHTGKYLIICMSFWVLVFFYGAFLRNYVPWPYTYREDLALWFLIAFSFSAGVVGSAVGFSLRVFSNSRQGKLPPSRGSMTLDTICVLLTLATTLVFTLFLYYNDSLRLLV